MTKPGPSVTSGADTQPGSDSLFPSGFGGGAAIRTGGVGTAEIADASVAAADLNLPSVAAALAARTEFTGAYVQKVAAPTGVSATDTAAIQAAHDALASTGGMLVLQPGTYDISGGLTFSKPVKVVGVGGGLRTSGVTLLTYSGATGHAITVSAHGCTFEDLALNNTSGTTPTAGSGFRFTAGIRTHMNRVTVSAFYDCVRFEDGCYQRLTDCDFVDAVRYCLYLSNPNGTDNGDQFVHGCQIGGYALNRIPTAAVYWTSGGGLKFVNNKINCSQTYIDGVHASIGTGLLAEVADGVSTSVLVVTGNSIEGWNSAAIDIKQVSGGTTGSIGKIVVSGNEIAGNSGTAIAIHPATATSFREVVIEGNSIGNCSTSILLANLTATKIGANVHKAVTGTIISSANTVTDLHVEQQVVSGDSITLYNEASADTNSIGPYAQAAWPLSREIGNVTSNSAYTLMYRASIPSFAAGKFNVTFYGNLNGVGAFYYDNVVTYTRGNGGAVTATAGTATTSGGVVDVQFDTATASGEIQVGIKRNTTNGTAIKGRCYVVLVGHVSNIKKGA